MTEPLQIAILAAGEGKRMRSATPKVLHALGGRPLLAHVLETARRLAPRATCVVYGEDAVKEYFPEDGLLWARQSPPLGTADALRCALGALPADGVTLVMFGADPMAREATLRNVVERARSGALSLLTAELTDPSGYGRIVRDPSGRVAAIVEQKDATAAQRAIREINTGMMAAPTARLRTWLERIDRRNASGEYYLTNVALLAVQDGVAVETTRATSETEAMGVNSMRDLAELERRYQRQRADELLDAGVSLADPARIDLRGSIECGRDVSIDVNCIFEGKVTLGNGVRIGAHCILKDASIGELTAIAPFSQLENAGVGARCRIGPFARIRPGTALADEVHIGNFVEVKASSFGERSKANHLSYVGDTVVGRDVNIGAGTITCNYDGAAKHRTVIEDDVHIGSDTQLVAPVTVGRGATVGAGTTVWKDVPPEALVINDKTQVARSGWKRPRKG
ncbi:MAG TPA: bifunctional UDP-N-acetylglucosamine diphosphorylase/glucosamine-1-phosphate N-acetyltransferase GlmU [Casimicrobiaceae bacterium]|nr:bifunctional UDP-N-acetylglucosamine diphosphorylase/glucosamine-1-phosphate N-acetyltransferase GlmU [Casimicrobiaceae bacterium]